MLPNFEIFQLGFFSKDFLKIRSQDFHFDPFSKFESAFKKLKGRSQVDLCPLPLASPVPSSSSRFPFSAFLPPPFRPLPCTLPYTFPYTLLCTFPLFPVPFVPLPSLLPFAPSSPCYFSAFPLLFSLPRFYVSDQNYLIMQFS